MAIDFPPNPSNGTTYAFNSITWSWNGVAWDRQSTSGGSGVTGATGPQGVTGPVGDYVVSFNGKTGALQGVSSFNGATGAITFTNYVISFNGLTGAVAGASLGANTFNGLNTFNAGISAAGATFGATVTIAGGTAWHSLNDGAGSGLDADLVRGVAGQRFAENLQTGILYGGIISVNAGNTATVDITAGTGIVVTTGASLTAMPVPVVTTVTWAAQTAVALPQIANYDETWISFNSSGVVTLRNTAWTNAQYASEIPIGAVYHVNRSSVNLVKNYPHVAYGQADQMDPFLRAFGPLKLSGHEISANGANLSVNRTSGTAYAIGRNYQTDPNNPNVVTDSGATPASVVYRFYKNGGTGYTTVINSVIDPDFYDDGTGTLHATGSTKWQIQRIFYLPNQTNTIGVYYGTIQYTNLNDAQFGLLTETFAESESTATQGIFLGYLLVKGSCTDLSDTAKAKFVQAGLFRNVSSGGGSGLVTTSIDDLSDVVITSAANDNLLRYSGGQWINSAISTLPLVASFNGRTGAVQGVSAAVAGTGISVSGATGSVTITNTGVQSFNGLTGAVAGVTTSTANIFTALNSFSAGVSASALTVAGGATFSADIAVNGVRVGRGAGSVATNTVLGAGAAAANTSGANNIFVGSAAGDALTTGARNIAIGSDALGAGVTANDNIAIGHNALLLVSSGVADGTVAIGSYALDALTTGTLNTAIGYNALGKTNTGSGNVAIGYLALENATTPSNNVAIGRYALNAKTSSGDGNVAIGTNAMVYASNGSNNTAIGQQVMGGAATTGSYNSAIGNAALYSLTTGQYNNAMGTYSLYALTTGSLNCGVGMDTLTSLTTGSSNTAIGGAAMRGVSSGDNNVVIGQNAGRYYGAAGITLTTILNNSTYIGYGTKPSADSVTNEMALGYIALGLGSNTTVIGNSNTIATTIYGLVNAPGGLSAEASSFSGAVTASGGVITDNISSISGSIYINSPAATTYIGDWNGVNNNTHIDVDDDLQTVTIAAANTNLYGTLVTNSTVTIADSVTIGVGLGLVNSQSAALTTTTANQTIASVSYNGYRSMEFFVQASTAGGAYEALKITALHDGTNTYNTQYGVIRSGGSLGTYTTILHAPSGILRLRVTPTTANTTYKVMITALPV